MKYFKIVLPYIIMIIFIPIYMMLDNAVFVKIFGCGCVPGAQTNILNIPFNANNLKVLVFGIFTIVMLMLQIYFTRNVQNTVIRAILCSTTFVLNLVIAFAICSLTMWE